MKTAAFAPPLFLFLLVAFVLVAMPEHLQAAPQIASPTFESDDLLLEGLDGLLDDLPEPESAPNPERPSANGGEDLGAGADNPLTRIEQGMATAEQLIAGPLVAERGGSAKTSRVQQQVISELDELIKQAEQQCQQCQSASSSSSSSQSKGRQQSQRSQPKPGDAKQASAGTAEPSGKPSGKTGKQQGNQSVARLQSAGSAAAAGRPPQELMKEVWGRLPQRLREQMLESSSDEFLPQYREEIEQYFRRLAEQPE